jgi:hypothetical protein
MNRMRIMKKVLGLIFLLTALYGSTRVAYTRPGFMMRIPTTSTAKTPYLFRTGVGSEIHNFNPINTSGGVFFDIELSRGFAFGFSAVKGGDTTRVEKLLESTNNPPVEFGFHFQQRVYMYNDISLSVGLQDVVFESSADTEGILNLNTDLLSFFAVLGSEKDLGDYKMNTYFGFGTGGLAPVSNFIDTTSINEQTVIDTTSSPESNAGIFIGFGLKTPYFARWGGMDIVGEFDGSGVNVGLRIPLTSDYRLNLGFTHLDQIPNWKDAYWIGHSGITIGFSMEVPRDASRRSMGGGPSALTNVYGAGNKNLDSGEISLHRDSTIVMANVAVETLRDSMSLMNNEMRNLLVRLSAMEQNTKFLSDSLSSIKLETNVSEKNMNEALRHLSRSLRYFYAGDYREALKEVDLSLELNPNLALAYARRGSIYYKLGDVQRATINWNLALRLDPEYTDVRNILKAMHENKLKSANLEGE